MTHFSFHSSFKETSIECDRKKRKTNGALWYLTGDPTPGTSLLKADLSHVSFLPNLKEGRTWQKTTLALCELAWCLLWGWNGLQCVTGIPTKPILKSIRPHQFSTVRTSISSIFQDRHLCNHHFLQLLTVK